MSLLSGAAGAGRGSDKREASFACWGFARESSFLGSSGADKFHWADKFIAPPAARIFFLIRGFLMLSQLIFKL